MCKEIKLVSGSDSQETIKIVIEPCGFAVKPINYTLDKDAQELHQALYYNLPARTYDELFRLMAEAVALERRIRYAAGQ